MNRVRRNWSLVGVLVIVGTSGLMGQQAQPADPVKQLLETKACPGCFLAEAALSAADLGGANLVGANLFEANLYFVNLEKADLTGAQLGKANLGKARLKGANLSGADLSGADLTWATDVNFEGATTSSTTICPNGAAGPCL